MLGLLTSLLLIALIALIAQKKIFRARFSRRDFLAFNLPLPAGAVAGNGKNQGCHRHNLGYNLCGHLPALVMHERPGSQHSEIPRFFVHSSYAL